MKLQLKYYYFLAALFYLLAVSFHIVQNYQKEEKAIMKEIDTLLEKSVQTVPLLLVEDFHSLEMLKNPISQEIDTHNREKLSKLAKTWGVKYVYTLIQDGDKIIFTSSSATDEELKTNTNLSYFGDHYEDVSPIVFEVLTSGKKAFDQYTDKWGSFHTLYIPMVANDGMKYIVGADIDISNIDGKLHQNLLSSFGDMLYYIGILIPFFLVYRTHMHRIKYELEEIISHRTQELQIKQKQIYQQSKMASMGEMLANIAHQWRQPLSVISSTASGIIIQDELDILEKKSLHKGLEDIVTNVQFLSQTIDNFRNFFSPNKNKERKNITEIFITIDAIFGNSLQTTDIEVIKNIEEFTVNTYVNELAQVIVNLIKNGKDAIGHDGVIFIDCSIGEDITIQVKDSGGGIPLDIIDKIYDPYFTTKHQSVGTGIGLNMSYQIITEHLGGKIQVKNVTFIHNGKQMEGAEFTITLPSELVID